MVGISEGFDFLSNLGFPSAKVALAATGNVPPPTIEFTKEASLRRVISEARDTALQRQQESAAARARAEQLEMLRRRDNDKQKRRELRQTVAEKSAAILDLQAQLAGVQEQQAARELQLEKIFDFLSSVPADVPQPKEESNINPLLIAGGAALAVALFTNG